MINFHALLRRNGGRTKPHHRNSRRARIALDRLEDRLVLSGTAGVDPVSTTITDAHNLLAQTTSALNDVASTANTELNNVSSALGTMSSTVLGLRSTLNDGLGQVNSELNQLMTSITDQLRSSSGIPDQATVTAGIGPAFASITDRLNGLVQQVQNTVGTLTSQINGLSSGSTNGGSGLALSTDNPLIGQLISDVNSNLNVITERLNSLSSALASGQTQLSIDISAGLQSMAASDNPQGWVLSMTVTSDLEALMSRVSATLNAAVDDTAQAIAGFGTALDDATASLGGLSNQVDRTVGIVSRDVETLIDSVEMDAHGTLGPLVNDVTTGVEALRTDAAVLSASANQLLSGATGTLATLLSQLETIKQTLISDVTAIASDNGGGSAPGSGSGAQSQITGQVGSAFDSTTAAITQAFQNFTPSGSGETQDASTLKQAIDTQLSQLSHGITSLLGGSSSTAPAGTLIDSELSQSQVALDALADELVAAGGTAHFAELDAVLAGDIIAVDKLHALRMLDNAGASQGQS